MSLIGQRSAMKNHPLPLLNLRQLFSGDLRTTPRPRQTRAGGGYLEGISPRITPYAKPHSLALLHPHFAPEIRSLPRPAPQVPAQPIRNNPNRTFGVKLTRQGNCNSQGRRKETSAGTLTRWGGRKMEEKGGGSSGFYLESVLQTDPNHPTAKPSASDLDSQWQPSE